MLEELYAELIKLETVEECENFLSDLCTMKELLSMGQRLKAAKMLLEEIQKENPDIESVMIGVHEQKKLDNQLIALPEFRMI